MFVRLVDKKSKQGVAINIDTILYVSERKEENRNFLCMETIKGVYKIYFESEEARSKAFEALIRKKGILNLEGVEQSFFRSIK